MYLAIDIGGTKTLLTSFNDKGIEERSLKFPTPKDYNVFLKELESNVDKLSTEKPLACCIAAPGRIDHERGSIFAFGNLQWENVSILNDTSSFLDCPVYLENDSKLAGLSEARLLPDCRKVLYLTISTGIGSALVIDGSLDGTTLGSEVGHMLFEKDGKVMSWQSFASGKAIVRRFGKMASEITDKHIWQIISHDISLGLIDVIANVSPDIVVIGGGVGTHFPKYGELLKQELNQYKSPMFTIPPIAQARHPEKAVIYGCLELLKDRYAITT